MTRANDLLDRVLPVLRRCMKCREEFKAEGRYNRVCPRCSRENEQVAPLPTFGFGQHRIGEAGDLHE
jgi:hypothetical protein